jgi:hypothetical protein
VATIGPVSAGAQTNNELSEIEARHRAELDAQREEFHRELGRRAFRIGELEEEVIEVAKTYEGSLSWRITRPVRAARTVLAKLRRG